MHKYMYMYMYMYMQQANIHIHNSVFFSKDSNSFGQQKSTVSVHLVHNDSQLRTYTLSDALTAAHIVASSVCIQEKKKGKKLDRK